MIPFPIRGKFVWSAQTRPLKHHLIVRPNIPALPPNGQLTRGITFGSMNYCRQGLDVMNGAVSARLADQIRRTSEPGEIVELISGEIVRRSAPPREHAAIVAKLHAPLSEHVDKHDLGAVFQLPWPLELSKFDVVRPDLYFTALQRSVPEADGVRGAPELVVEVISPETRERDRGEKKRLYLWSGVFEYWLVDPEHRTFTAMQKGKNSFEPIEHDGLRFNSVLIEDFSLDLESLFA
jgi:Uma2 family endonuclease